MDGVDLADGGVLRLHRPRPRRHDDLGAAAPGGGARRGVLGLDTTRGDRLFITLLGSAFIHLAWLGLAGPPVWAALGISIVYGIAVFRWV